MFLSCLCFRDLRKRTCRESAQQFEPLVMKVLQKQNRCRKRGGCRATGGSCGILGFFYIFFHNSQNSCIKNMTYVAVPIKTAPVYRLWCRRAETRRLMCFLRRLLKLHLLAFIPSVSKWCSNVAWLNDLRFLFLRSVKIDKRQQFGHELVKILPACRRPSFLIGYISVGCYRCPWSPLISFSFHFMKRHLRLAQFY